MRAALVSSVHAGGEVVAAPANDPSSSQICHTFSWQARLNHIAHLHAWPWPCACGLHTWTHASHSCCYAAPHTPADVTHVLFMPSSPHHVCMQLMPWSPHASLDPWTMQSLSASDLWKPPPAAAGPHSRGRWPQQAQLLVLQLPFGPHTHLALCLPLSLHVNGTGMGLGSVSLCCFNETMGLDEDNGHSCPGSNNCLVFKMQG